MIKKKKYKIKGLRVREVKVPKDFYFRTASAYGNKVQLVYLPKKKRKVKK